MIESDKLCAQADVSRAALTSDINCARTPQALAGVLAGEAMSHLLAFDSCILLLPEADGQHLRVLSAQETGASGMEAAAAFVAFDNARTLLKQLIAEGAARLLSESDLQSRLGGQIAQAVKSAIALPLSFGGQCFGLLCFASATPGAFTLDDASRLAWLADHVAASAQALLLRARLDAVSDSVSEIERLKSGFVNTLVRDVRLPLTSVLGLLELFESKLQAREPFDLEDRQLLGNAIENGDRMRHLLDDHLEIARQHEQPLTLELENVGVAELLEDVAEPLRGEAALRGVELNITVAAQIPEMYADARQTRRALCHLLKFALAATPDGGAINIEAQAIMGTRLGDEGRRFVIVNIADSGEGITANEVPFVFDAFWQSSGSQAAGGGLGLAIARRIAAAHSGNVSVRSQRGMGTVYTLVLPASQQVSLSKMPCILIVEDAPELLLLLRKLVGRMGYRVEAAAGAAEALEILRTKSIDLLVTDWAMPGMNGGELIAALKADERLRHIPAIVLTGHDTERERMAAAAAGCDHFLVKPIKCDELQRQIVRLLSTATVS
ncbi:MAG TPA: hybrid sensor histidine kinase/response regulator [Pyrinomonadaceae bacterium]